MKKISKNKFYLFSILYISFAVMMTIYLWINGRVEVNGTDAAATHYPAMLYISKYYKNFWGGLFHGQLTLPMYDTAIGLGEDIMVTLNWLGFGNPFYIITSFVSENLLIYFYTVFFYLQVYIGGMCFMLLAERIYPKKHTYAYAAGAFLYCCSGFAFESEVHIIFVHVLIYAPLILYAVDRVLFGEKKSKRLLVIASCFLAMSGFFYLYIISIGAVVFAFVRWFNNRDRLPFKNLWHVAGVYSLGLCCSAVVLIPELYGFLHSYRAGKGIEIGLLYDYETYKDMLYRMILMNRTCWGMAALPVTGYFGILVLIISKGKIKERLLVISSFVLMGIPFVSWFMSGCSSVIYNRWEILIAVLLCVIFVASWEKICDITWKKYIVCVSVLIIAIMLGIIDGTITKREFRNAIIGSVVTLLAFAAIIVVKKIQKNFILLILTIVCSAVTWFTNGSREYAENVEAANSGKLDSYIVDSEEDFFRIENGEVVVRNELNSINRAMISGYNATSEYWSIINGDMSRAYEKWGLEHNIQSFGLDMNSIIESLCSVKYLLLKQEDIKVPYGFEIVSVSDDGSYNIYVNRNMMPLGYLYYDTIDYEVYDEFDPVKRMLSMSKAIAVKDLKDGDMALTDGGRIEEEDILYDDIICVELVEELNGNYHYAIKYNARAGYNSYLLLKSTEGAVYLYYPRGPVDGTRCFSIGYSDNDKVEEIDLILTNQIDAFDVQIANLKMSSIDTNLKDLRNSGKVKLEMKEDMVEGEVYSDDYAFLCVSLPFSLGWTAYVDNVETKIYQANDMFMGINIPPGSHSIKMKYTTPYIRIGAIISGMAVCVAIFFFICFRRRSRQNLCDNRN
ncbi:MAG: YfhO family protein [Lachnospiraceae bacterium]|nr:YfhO family protein [Lachnospiraceae bacterium]